MHKRNRIFSFFLVVVLLLCGITVEAKESTKTNKGSIVKEITFSTDDTVETLKKQKNDYFPETIKVDGKQYRLKTVDYKVLDKTPISIEKEVQKVVDSDFIPAGTEYQPEDAIEDNGVTYKLDKVETEEKTADDTYIQTVTGYTDYDHAVSRSDVPATKNVTATNQRTGQQETVTCNLSSIDQIGSSGWEDTYIDIVFESYDAQIFHWNGVTVTKDVSSPLAGYENNLLASVGADSSNYQVLRTEFKFRYTYLQDTFPDPDRIILSEVNTEDSSYIDQAKRVWDYDITFRQFNEAENVREEDFVKKLKHMNEKYYSALKQSLKKIFGDDYEEKYGIDEEMPIEEFKIFIQDSRIKESDKKAILTVIQSERWSTDE